LSNPDDCIRCCVTTYLWCCLCWSRWLEKLGLSAYMGVGVVMRQTFYGGNYGLMNHNYRPNPVRITSFMH